MNIINKILISSLIPLGLFTIGGFVSGVVIYKAKKETKAHVEIYAKRQESLSKIYQTIGYGGAIHNFKNYILRGEDQYYSNAKKELTQSLKDIHSYKSLLNISEIEIKAMDELERTLMEYQENLNIAREMVLKDAKPIEIDDKVKVDDTPAKEALFNLVSYFNTKKMQQLKNLEAIQDKAFLFSSLVLVLAFCLSVIFSKYLSEKILMSIKKVFQISKHIEDQRFDPESVNLSDITEDEIKDLGLQLVNMNKTIEEKIMALNISNQYLENFAQLASHDIQEPIKKVSAYVDLLAMEGNFDERTKNYMNEIKFSTKRMVVLIKSIMDYAKLRNKDIVLTKVDLNEVLEEAIRNLEVTIIESKLSIESYTLPFVKGDYNLLVLLFQNLLTNAIKYRRGLNEPKVKVVSKFNQENRTWVINFIDNGHGVEEKYRELIFKPFFRIPGSETRLSGTGIGLALCKSIVNSHHSEIHLTSNLDEGCEFSFELTAAL